MNQAGGFLCLHAMRQGQVNREYPTVLYLNSDVTTQRFDDSLNQRQAQATVDACVRAR